VATFLSLAAWLVFGFFAASVAQQPEPKNYVLNVLNSGELDLQAPLRWHGMLRDEPIVCVIGASHNYVANTCSLPSRWIKRFSFAFLLAAAVTMATFPFAPTLAAWLLRIERT
jgi:hypothetical protein